MHSAFVFQFCENSLALDQEADLAITTQFSGIGAYLLDFPALTCSVHGVHSQQRIGEKSGFFATGAGSYFDDAAAVVVRVLGQEQYLQFLIQLFHERLVIVVFALGKLAQFGVGAGLFKRGNGVVEASLCLFVFLPDFHQRSQALVFSHQVAVKLVVSDNRGVGKLNANFVVARFRNHKFVVHNLSSVQNQWVHAQKLQFGILVFADDGFYLFLALGTRYHENMSAALAAQPEIRTAALYEHFVAPAAGVFLFHHENVSDFDIHMFPRSFHVQT